jgi:drug/metabolite transporter (DMT)-like permease
MGKKVITLNLERIEELNSCKSDFLASSNETLTNKEEAAAHTKPQPVYSERMCILFYFLANVLFGLNTFQIKLVAKVYPEGFNANSFFTWRSIFLIPISIAGIRYTGERITRLNEVKNKFWFYCRTLLQFFSIIFLVNCMLELRASTASCISSMHPILVLIFSIILLKERFYTRYLVGLVICCYGAMLIVLNERAPASQPHIDDLTLDDDLVPLPGQITEVDNLKFVRGLGYGAFHLLAVTLVVIGIKVVSLEKISTNVQCFYLGIFNTLQGFLFALFGFPLSLNPMFIFNLFINAVLVYFGTYFQVQSLKYISVNKVSPLTYICTLTVFVLSVLLLGESIFLTDIIGSMLILSFNVYNSAFPIKH